MRAIDKKRTVIQHLQYFEDMVRQVQDQLNASDVEVSRRLATIYRELHDIELNRHLSNRRAVTIISGAMVTLIDFRTGLERRVNRSRIERQILASNVSSHTLQYEGFNVRIPPPLSSTSR